METWIVAHDFSPCSDVAVEEAARVAERLGAKLVLLHVHQALAPEADLELEDTLRDRLGLVAAAVRKRHPLLRSVEVDVVPSRDPAHGILDEARRLSVDHIVVGTHGRRGIEHLVLGSVAEKVARDAYTPVTIVRAH